MTTNSAHTALPWDVLSGGIRVKDKPCTMPGPVLQHNFDLLAARAGLAECFVRRYDQKIPPVPLLAEAREEFGRYLPYPLEGPQDGDVVVRAEATPALVELCRQLGVECPVQPHPAHAPR
ncbi:hypothetical protein [Streptomyces sp. NPDC003660]